MRIKDIFEKNKKGGWLAVCYALLTEALLIGFVMFATLFTLETLLPTFVSDRLNLSIFFFVLVLGTFVLAALGRYLDIDFASGLRLRSLLVWLGITWIVGITAISLYKFPPVLIPVIILAFLGIGYLFLSLFFEEKA